MEAGVAHLAIVPRSETPPETSKPPQSLRENFDRYYMVLALDKTVSLPQ